MPLNLPDFPWDALVPYAERARAHPRGMIDLSVGSPVDATSAVIREALAAAGDAHGYPHTAGTPELRDAIVEWFARRRGVELGIANVLPTIGSKEFVAGLPLFLGLGPGDTVVHPSVAYPTYALGAAVVGAAALAEDDPALWPETTRLVWLNSPGNPDGRVLSVDELRAAVARARELDAVIASDECYTELNWVGDRPTSSILDPEVIDGSRHNILAVCSLSKQSNLAGYRAGFVAGCSQVLGQVLGVRKHLGLMTPTPVQAAMVTALGDEAHVDAQREVYRARRGVLRAALEASGFRIDHSEAGLYLWATSGSSAWETVARFAEAGILVVPGTFYGDDTHVRVALTASDEDVADAARRLEELSSRFAEV
ncbi:succinyldiaminopimelate transaminase [Cryobacterium mesophilum]|uniref:Aminotransferase n=1 Tax=Terrimesophilobacter mesophilus TaxID=433647 RepID=A0A4R8VB50_9MICO|nr:succinyldiaminopimelate transaminase [Terrimesophilobacter mesophilus]MBB5633832.1 succinyldiaminopimelate transaminase [Terrimesophilobacter mesophilus]TFB80511.1 succinyldiaminopimelate transaminase [Terrimesophilobacter mesophilus]